MTDRPTSSFFSDLADDARLNEAISRLPVAAFTGNRLDAEGAVRAFAIAAACRALGCRIRHVLPWQTWSRTPRRNLLAG